MKITSFSYVGLVPEHLNTSIINMWTCDHIQPSLFYQTGFETIFYNHHKIFALQCVLSSVVPSDKEIVIAGSHISEKVVSVADKFEIPSIVFDTSPEDVHLIETFLYAQSNVSHLVLVIGNDDDQVEKYIRQLQPVLQHQRIELILFCDSAVQGINDRTNGSVDYMIGGWDEIPDNSFVVARRNKLVQTEGNSRSLTHDLYASWQWALRGRESHITPMEM